MKKNKRVAVNTRQIFNEDGSPKVYPTNPNFYQFEIDIKEKDGTIHTVPAWGSDLQDAIWRLRLGLKPGKGSNILVVLVIIIIVAAALAIT